MLKAPLSRGGFDAAVGNQTWLKHWPFGRLLSAVSHVHHKIINVSHNQRFLILEHYGIAFRSSRSYWPVITAQTFLTYISMYCTSQIRVTRLAGAVTSHTGKQSLKGLKQTFLNQHGTGGWISWPHSDSAAEYFKMFTLQETNISHVGKRIIVFKECLGWAKC